MRKLLLTVFVFIILHLDAQEFRIAKGGVTDSLPIADAPGETYALYVPRDYTPEQEWPIVFVFDPKGRGANTANLFRMAAEDQQYIIASSNIG